MDKITIAALVEVLKLYTDPDRLADRLPLLRNLVRPLSEIQELAEKLLPIQSDAVFEKETSGDESGQIHAPKDYATKSTRSQAGALSESFGLKRSKTNTRTNKN